MPYRAAHEIGQFFPIKRANLHAIDFDGGQLRIDGGDGIALLDLPGHESLDQPRAYSVPSLRVAKEIICIARSPGYRQVGAKEDQIVILAPRRVGNAARLVVTEGGARRSRQRPGRWFPDRSRSLGQCYARCLT